MLLPGRLPVHLAASTLNQHPRLCGASIRLSSWDTRGPGHYQEAFGSFVNWLRAGCAGDGGGYYYFYGSANSCTVAKNYAYAAMAISIVFALVIIGLQASMS